MCVYTCMHNYTCCLATPGEWAATSPRADRRRGRLRSRRGRQLPQESKPLIQRTTMNSLQTTLIPNLCFLYFVVRFVLFNLVLHV